MLANNKVILSQNLPVRTHARRHERRRKPCKRPPKPLPVNQNPKSGVPLLPDEYTRIDKTPLVQEVPAKAEIVYDIRSK